MLSNSFLYGKGVFTTIAISDGQPQLWGKHWKRLSGNASATGVDLDDYNSDRVFAELCRVIDQKELVEGKVRITFFDERSSEIWPDCDCLREVTGLSILVGERNRLPHEFRFSVSPFPTNSRSPLAGIKSCNYLEPIMSLDEAKGRGFDEAVRVNERGFVTSACMANVFWLKGGELFTPGLATGCLAGTTREFVLENIDCREVEVGIEELENADTIFLTSAGIGVVQVAEFEGTTLEKVDHSILKLLPY